MNQETQTIIQDQAIFEIWCRMVAADVLKSTMISEDTIVTSLKVSILENKSLFIDCITDRIDHQISKAKKKAQLLLRSGRKREYEKQGYVLAELNDVKKQLNIARSKAKIVNGGKRQRLWNFVNEKYNDIFEEWLEDDIKNR